MIAKDFGHAPTAKTTPALVVPTGVLVCSRAQNLSCDWFMSEISCHTSLILTFRQSLTWQPLASSAWPEAAAMTGLHPER